MVRSFSEEYSRKPRRPVGVDNRDFQPSIFLPLVGDGCNEKDKIKKSLFRSHLFSLPLPPLRGSETLETATIRSPKHHCKIVIYVVSFIIGSGVFLVVFPFMFVSRFLPQSSLWSRYNSESTMDVISLVMKQLSSQLGNSTPIANCNFLVEPFLKSSASNEEYQFAERLYTFCREEALRKHGRSVLSNWVESFASPVTVSPGDINSQQVQKTSTPEQQSYYSLLVSKLKQLGQGSEQLGQGSEQLGQGIEQQGLDRSSQDAEAKNHDPDGNVDLNESSIWKSAEEHLSWFYGFQLFPEQQSVGEPSSQIHSHKTGTDQKRIDALSTGQDVPKKPAHLVGDVPEITAARPKDPPPLKSEESSSNKSRRPSYEQHPNRQIESSGSQNDEPDQRGRRQESQSHSIIPLNSKHPDDSNDHIIVSSGDEEVDEELDPIIRLRRDMLRQYGTWYGCDGDQTIKAMKDLKRWKSVSPITQRFLQPERSKGGAHENGTNILSGRRSVIQQEKPRMSPDGDINLINVDESLKLTEAVDSELIIHEANVQKDQNFLPSDDISSIPWPPYRLALLFMINNELRHPHLWTKWLQSADMWSRELYEKREGPYKGLRQDQPYVQLFSLHVHFMGRRGGLYRSLKNVWRKLGLRTEVSLEEEGELNDSKLRAFNQFEIFHEDRECTFVLISKHRNSIYDSYVSPLAADDPRFQLPQIFQDAIIPTIRCGWGNLNPCEYQLLKYGMQDGRTNGFAFVSESTVPVKPFSFIYDEFQRNPRSRFFFSNINLPLVRKHHQWIILNRQHAAKLVGHPNQWTCNSWMIHHYPDWHVLGNVAAPDEYLPFYALSDIIGIDRIMLEVNGGYQEDLRLFNNTFQVHGDRNFRHTWLCWWELPDYINTEPCGTIGEYSRRLGSPVTYYKIFSHEFQELIIKNRNVWFARKFEKDCTVQLESTGRSPSLRQQPSAYFSTSATSKNDAGSDGKIILKDVHPQVAGGGLPLVSNHLQSKFGVFLPRTVNMTNAETYEIPNSPSQTSLGNVNVVSTGVTALGSSQTSSESDIISLEDWLTAILVRDSEYFSNLSLHTYDAQT